MGLFKSKLVLFLVVVLTIFAISSPFWLFHSEEKGERPQGGAEEKASSVVEQSKGTTGEIDLNTLTKAESSVKSGTEDSVKNSTEDNAKLALLNKTNQRVLHSKGGITESAPQEQENAQERVKAKMAANSNTSASINSNPSNNNVSNKISRTISDHIDNVDNIDAELSADPNLNQPHITDLLKEQRESQAIKQLAKQIDKQTGKQASQGLNSQATDTANTGALTSKDSKTPSKQEGTAIADKVQDKVLSQQVEQSKGSTENQSKAAKADSKGTEPTQDIAKAKAEAEEATKAKDSKDTKSENAANAENTANATKDANTTNSPVKEATDSKTAQKNAAQEDSATSNSLQAQVDSLVNKQTSADKDKYQQALNERYEQVTWAVETIKANSRIYLPESLSSRAVIVYFGVDVTPPKGNRQEVDSLTGASKLALEPEVIYTEHGKELKPRFKYGSGVQYIADILQEESGSTLYEVMTVDSYPKDSVLLYETAFREQISKKRPELMDDQSIDFTEYDTIYLCYAIWWEDLPMPVYSFLDKYDLSGKMIIPLCLSRRDGFEKTISRLRMAEPNASIRNSWRIRPNELETTEFRQKIRDWLVNVELQISEGSYNY